MGSTNRNIRGRKLEFSYGLGEFGFTFFLLFVGYYLMYYLTDVIMLPVGIAATLYTLVQWFETITIVISGTIVDRFRFKSGRFRPWMLGGSIACMIGTVLVFTKWNFSASAWIIAFPVFYLIAYWGYNFMWVTYRALNGIISKDSKESVNLAVTGSQLGTVSSLIFSAIGVNILYGFSKIETGFTVSALLYGGLMVLCMYIVFRISKPYDKPAEIMQGQRCEKRNISLKEIMVGLKGPMVAYFIATTLRSSVAAAIPALVVYYFNCVISKPELLSVYMTIITGAQFAGVFAVKIIAAKMGKIGLYKMSAVGQGICLISAYFVVNQPWLFIAALALNQFFSILPSSLMPSFMNDIELYNEYKYNVNIRAFSYSIAAAAVRLASIIGGALASFGLVIIGYDAQAAVQSASVINGLSVLMTLAAGTLMLCSLIPMMFYKLNDETMAPIYKLNENAEQTNENN